ncbi:hypothetical protein [Agathobacter sp.]
MFKKSKWDKILFDEVTGKYKVNFFDNSEIVFDKHREEEYAKSRFEVISISAKIVMQAENNAGVAIRSE